MSFTNKRSFRWVLRIVLLLPIAFWAYELFYGKLGADPTKTLNHKFGQVTFYYLLINLLIGIAISFSKGRWPFLRHLILQRRTLGVISYLFLLGHIFFYFLMESFGPQAWSQLYTKTYLIFGVLAFLVFTVLAMTSNNFSVRKLGGKQWKQIHRLIYLASVFITVHVLSIEKADLLQYGSLLAGLWLLQSIRFFRWLRTKTTSERTH